MKIVNVNYDLKGSIDTDIVLISDIHYYSKKDLKQLNKVLDNIKKIKPKFICIPGDLIDEAKIKDEICFINWLNKLSNISRVLITLGNHEFYINKNKGIFGLNEKFLNEIRKINNLYLLDNDNVILDNINFIGITLPIEYYHQSERQNTNFSKYFKNIKNNPRYYNILLCHSPIDICNESILKYLNIDLILCGHTHGGATPRILRPILKKRGLISPKKRLFPKIAYGSISSNYSNIIITSGVTVISHINKFRLLKNLFPSEIVHITIKT